MKKYDRKTCKKFHRFSKDNYGTDGKHIEFFCADCEKYIGSVKVMVD